jgi:hypothetical protein
VTGGLLDDSAHHESYAQFPRKKRKDVKENKTKQNKTKQNKTAAITQSLG